MPKSFWNDLKNLIETSKNQGGRRRGRGGGREGGRERGRERREKGEGRVSTPTYKELEIVR